MLGSHTKTMHFFLILLFWQGANTVSINSSLTEDVHKAVISGQSEVIEKIEILEPQTKVFSCETTNVPNKPPNISGYWKKNGAAIESSQQAVNNTDGKYIFSGTFNMEDLGNYSCVFSFSENVRQATFVLNVPAIKGADKPIVSYIGDSVVLKCEIKYGPKTWEWFKVNGTEKEFINATVDTSKYKLCIETNVTKLTVMNLTKEDAGKYLCSAVYDIGPSQGHVELKVLSFTEPLKPFLAIAAEVVVLVTLILLYERQSRSRKQDSETTENGPQSEQTSKLTQDESNGTDGGSSTRHRRVEQ
ncbi:embigin [Astyanax mexicanus]|uniref:Embigin n=1 Tax=Astyanax mexicanus TaxID=7994 RepID=A0A3B1KH49_ASTMX|nr:embigin [Astyanax mexicanus]